MFWSFNHESKNSLSLQKLFKTMVNLNNDIHLFNEDAIKIYSQWESPTVIISDGPYGIKGFPGDLKTE